MNIAVGRRETILPCPHCCREVKGVAVAEGLFRQKKVAKAVEDSDHCSMFAVWGSRTMQSKLFSGRNLDWYYDTGKAVTCSYVSSAEFKCRCKQYIILCVLSCMYVQCIYSMYTVCMHTIHYCMCLHSSGPSCW